MTRPLKFNPVVTREIVICQACEGKGYTVEQELVDYHRGEYRDKIEYCGWCNSSGRLCLTTTKIYSNLSLLEDSEQGAQTVLKTAPPKG